MFDLPALVNEFFEYLEIERNLSHLTIRDYRHYLENFASRSFLRYLIRKDLPVVPPEKIDLPKVESRSLKFLDRDQLERLLAQPDISGKQGIRDKTIMEMLFSTGLRVSELCKLNRDQINLERREFGV